MYDKSRRWRIRISKALRYASRAKDFRDDHHRDRSLRNKRDESAAPRPGAKDHAVEYHRSLAHRSAGYPPLVALHLCLKRRGKREPAGFDKKNACSPAPDRKRERRTTQPRTGSRPSAKTVDSFQNREPTERQYKWPRARSRCRPKFVEATA